MRIKLKYNIGDMVEFNYFACNKIGTIQIVDTFPNSTLVEYDIYVQNENRLYKHIDERYIIGLINEIKI